MSYEIIYPQGDATIAVGAGESVAVWSPAAGVQVFQRVGFPNYPPQQDELTGPLPFTQTVYGPFSAAATIVINANASTVYYTVGTAPVVPVVRNWQAQPAPTAFTAADTATAAAILGGLVTMNQNTGATVALTLVTGALLDAASDFAVNDSFDWSIINLSTGSNTVTLTASTNHTIVWNAVLAVTASARYRTRKTAADTFVTYRIAG